MKPLVAIMDTIMNAAFQKNGEFLLTNQYDGIVIAVNAEGEVKYTIPLNTLYCTFDVEYINDSTLAVSTGFSFNKHGGINIVDLIERKLVKFIDLPDCTYGITYAHH